MADEEEVLIEVEAVQSVYGDDCVVLSRFPPHLQVHIKPRTADVSSQQFVEAVVGIKAGTKYPEEPPQVDLIDHKGLDEQRQKDLLARIQERAHELTTCLMLVALCEAAVERLSAMNHPEGNCPLCLFPLVPEDEDNNSLPFMKLMSCFHCFHSECIIRWWNWIQKDRENSISISKDKGSGVSEGNCPVCRKVFQARDIEHVLNLVGSYSYKLSPEGEGASKDDEEEVLESDSEKDRRQKFEAILKLQQDKNGLIEPKKDLVVMPGMFLPAPPPPPAASSEPSSETAEEQEPEPPLERTNRRDQEGSSSSHARRSTNNRKFGARRRYRGVHNTNNSSSSSNNNNNNSNNNNNNNARKQTRNCWVRKEDNSGG